MADTTDAGQKTTPVPSSIPAGSVTPSKDSESGASTSASTAGEVRDGRFIPERVESDGPVGFDANPHGNYDLMSVEELQGEADRLGVGIPRDVLKGHLITALRAGITGTR